ncbi:MAG: hypothetical protein Q9165_000088 [Trypethelium subeluteriae]
MRFPKLTPLQSRFVASLVASIIILVIYYILSNPHTAYAATLDSIQNQDHNHHRLAKDSVTDSSFSRETEEGIVKLRAVDEEGTRAGLDTRQDSPTILGNNVPKNDVIKPGATNQYVVHISTTLSEKGVQATGFPSPMFDGSSNQVDNGSGLAQVASSENAEWQTVTDQEASQKVYVSVTTCSQPSSNSNQPPPQLILCLSKNSNPGPSNCFKNITLIEGHADATLPSTDELYIAVLAPEVPSALTSEWSYEVAASIDAFYHSYSNSQGLLLLDTDSKSALFVSNNLTSATPDNSIYNDWMQMWPPPLTLFAHNTNDSSITGLRHSYCGLQNTAQIQPSAVDSGQMVMSMTERAVGLWGSSPEPKQQFYLNALNTSSTYNGIMAMNGNSTHSGPGVVNGGGQVWGPMSFKTKSDGNCQLLFNLKHCPNIAHAVPTSPQFSLNTSALASLYDSAADVLFQNFTYSLAQVPCNTTQTAQYSLARNCTDCANAYRNWLCAVMIPRCEDFSAPTPYTQLRNVNPLSQFVTPNPLNNFSPSGQNASIPSNILNNPTYVPMPSAPAAFAFLNQSPANALSANQSRNALAGCGTNLSASTEVPMDANGNPNCGIDFSIKPGPYNEILPCGEFCYELVRSCPASLQFTCPAKGRGFERSYRDLGANGSPMDSNGVLMCSFDGAIVNPSNGTANAARRSVPVDRAGLVVGMLVSGVFMVGLAAW